MTDREWAIVLPDGDILDPTDDQAEAIARLNWYRDTWPDAQLATRTSGPWTAASDQPGHDECLGIHNHPDGYADCDGRPI